MLHANLPHLLSFADKIPLQINVFILQLAYLTNAGNYAPVPTRGARQDDYVSLSSDNTLVRVDL